MGRKNKEYSISLSKQIYNRLTQMQAFGESKRDAMKDGTVGEKIFSYATYESYKKHIGYFVRWLKIEHPEVTTIKSAKRYVREWLEIRADQKDSKGRHLSAWTISLESAALSKLFGIDRSDVDRFIAPSRRRQDIYRSRNITEKDRHFSVANNRELIEFCRGTGCRRNVLERLKGSDLWTKAQITDEIMRLGDKKRIQGLDKKETARLTSLKDAVRHFPAESYFVHHRNDKGGRSRFSPIVGDSKEAIIQRFERTGRADKVWMHVPKNADIHSYRAEYAGQVYKKYARSIDQIPFDKKNRGTGHAYQSEVYVCRKDDFGKKFDRNAMLLCSKALGHNRISVVADHYLRNL